MMKHGTQCPGWIALAVIGWVGLLPAFAASPTLEVQANRDQLYLGESVVLTLKVSGADRDLVPDLSAITNAAVRFLESHSDSHFSMVIINGQMRRDSFTGRVFTYEVTPARAGTFVAGPIRVQAGKQTLQAPGPRLRVAGIEQQDHVIVELLPSRTSVLVDEPFSILCRLYLKMPMGHEIEPILPGDPPQLNIPYMNGAPIPGLDTPDLRPILQKLLVGNRMAPGFRINEYTVRSDPFDLDNMFDFGGSFGERPARFNFERKRTDRNGIAYFEYSLVLPYTPREEGNYTFGPVLFKGNVIDQVTPAGEASLQPVFAMGAACTVRVVPPPEERRPSCYIGAIGSNLTVEATLDTQTCNIGDPLSLTLTLGGAANLRNVVPPLLNAQTNLARLFRVYDDTIRLRQDGARRMYTYTLRPLVSGTVEMPPIEVAYYDVVSRSYRIVRTQPIPLRVNEATAMASDMVIATATNRLRIHLAGDDSPVPAGITVHPEGALPAREFPGWIGWILLGTGPCLYLLVLGYDRLLESLPFLRVRQRRRRAFANAQGCIRAAECSVETDTARASQALYRAIAGFVEDRLNLVDGTLTPDALATRLTEAGLDESGKRAVQGIAERCFQTTFSHEHIPADQMRDACRKVRMALHQAHRAPSGTPAPGKEVSA